MEKGINWNNFPTHQKRGSCCIKDNEGHWFVDNEIPMFKGDICKGECEKNRDASYKGYCQKCDKYTPRAKMKHKNRKKEYNEKQRGEIYE